ncbi:hypothetical protein EST38_g525 [Candolleomyces aberdarensis]|uniref:Rad60/SUMO-like domain-containing protein n=1 Tax=Candolleomyces aberdarensis TaxID=2316362 RepID=A0A4Q2E0I2_9AGAR|nr:hypothetical protein EST38_g525 [Candolleomyces aberdarensis]
MADAAPNRPRPRPRPRPKAKSPVTQPSTNAAGSSAAGPSTAPKKAATRSENDLDAMFMRNKNRSLKTWHKLEEIAKDDKGAIDIGSSSESDENASPRSRKRARKRPEALPKPKWQQDKNILRMLSAEPTSEDSDSDVAELSDPSATPNNSRRESKRKKQRQRSRSRSRSLTPPPMIPLQQVENVRKFVREALGNTNIPTIDLDDSTITLDPELERIVQQARQKTPHESRAADNSAVVDPDDTVVITVHWKPHPQDPKGKEVDWQYRINRTDSFYELFEEIADDAHIVASNLVVCYQGKRIFASVGPSVLNIWRDVEFTAYTKNAFEYIRANPDLSAYNDLSSQQPQTQAPPSNSRNTSSLPVVDISDSDEDDRATPRKAVPSFQSQVASQSQLATGAESQSETEDDDDKLKLTFRSAKTGSRDIVLTVRPTAKCGNILRAFLKKAGLEKDYPEVFADGGPPPPTRGKAGKKAAAAATPPKDPRLCVDGDRLDNESPISEADLEDGDLVEVVGL